MSEDTNHDTKVVAAERKNEKLFPYSELLLI
jgi:hypothetical protein